MLKVPSDAVPPVRVRARRTASAASSARRERALGLGPQQPAGVGELEPPAGAHEERDAELGLEVGDLLGDAGAREVQARRRRR